LAIILIWMMARISRIAAMPSPAWFADYEYDANSYDSGNGANLHRGCFHVAVRLHGAAIHVIVDRRRAAAGSPRFAM
jgi:hypothetical protein